MDPIFKELSDAEEKFYANDGLRWAYIKQRKEEKDYQNDLSVTFREGEIEAAKKFIKSGFPFDSAVSTLKLSDKEIQILKKRLEEE